MNKGDNIVVANSILDRINDLLKNVEEIKGLDVHLSVDKEAKTISEISIKLDYCKFGKSVDKEKEIKDTIPTTNPNPQYPFKQPTTTPNYIPDYIKLWEPVDTEWWKDGPQCSIFNLLTDYNE